MQNSSTATLSATQLSIYCRLVVHITDAIIQHQSAKIG